MRRSHLVTALSIGAAGLIWQTCVRSRAPEGEGLSSGHLALAAIFDGRRPIEPRLAGGFGYAPCRTLSRSSDADLVPDRVCSGPSTPERRAFVRAAHRIETEFEAGPSAAALHARAVLALVQGRDGAAVAQLQKVVALAPRNARAWSDLAAAYLVRAQRRDEPRDLARALAAAERAVQLDGGLEEARFNRALAVEALFLPAARERWQEVRDRETDRRWRGEAQRRLQELEVTSRRPFGDLERSRLAEAARRGELRTVEEIVRRHPQESREHAEETLFAAWAVASGRSAAGEPLTVARAVGEALAHTGGDTLVRDTVAAIDTAAWEGDADGLAALVLGHRAFGRGMEFYKAVEWKRGAEELAVARTALERGGSPFAGRAAFYEACCVHRLGRAGESAATFERLERELTGGSHSALLAHSSWMSGVLRVEAGDPVEGLRCYERSLSGFRRLGEQGNVAALHNLFPWPLQQIGRLRDAWEHAYLALRSAPEQGNPRRKNRPYTTAADAALADGYLEAALVFQDEAVRQAGTAGQAEVLADTLFWRGLMRYRANRRQEALEDVQLAREQVGRLSDPAARRRLAADLSMIEGEISLFGYPARAEALFTSALGVYQETRNHLMAVWVLRQRARALRRMGEFDRAEADLREALAAYERLGRGGGPELRLAVFARTEEAFDEMIAFQAFDRKEPEEAFRFADWARTRVLPGSATRSRAAGLDETGRRRLLAADPRPLDLDEIRRRLPGETSLVQYAVLPDRLLIWRVRRNGMLFRERRVSAEDLRARVARLRATAGFVDAWRQESSALFDLLVRPWKEGIGPGETVVLVPDKSLHAVPFAALQEPGTGRFLVQDLRIAVAPSATLAVDGPAGSEERASAGRVPALVVGDPSFDRGEWSGLTSLRAAAEEAAAVARAIPGSIVLEKERATRAAFLELASRSDRIHFAGHALADPVDPLRSLLLLAPSGPEDPGALYAWEVYGLDLAGTRLVVLAACGTADAALPAEEGVTSLARAFLAAGAPQVVASLWDVGDDAAGRLFQAFYGDPRALFDPVGTLRDTQLSLLEAAGEGSAPWDWGAFEVIATQIYR